jgi:hypothetical protein
LAEVEGTLGAGSATNRLHLLEAILKPMYTALPKNQHGNLGHSTVRYALHRLFIMRHGWHIMGLGREADTSNLTSPTGVLKDHVPSYIQNLFEKQLGDKGLGLRELAVMASTMEHLIHQEVIGKLGQVYNLMEMVPTQSVSEARAHELFDVYMMAFILGENLQKLKQSDARSNTAQMPQLYSGWNGTQEFVRRIHRSITSDPEKGTQQELNFQSLSKVLEVVGEEFGTFQQTDCDNLKTTLMKMEHRDTGRVKLSNFYKPGLDGNWQFTESVGYLRQLGALDESDPKNPSVVIANYVHSFANCIAPSGFYSVCCKDECEGLLGHLEEKIANNEATPTTIVSIVEQLPSSTVVSPRQLSATLLSRLEDIAAEHGGKVPLHGRLFAQWMHHAYPRECLFPHLSGTTSQQSPDEYGYDSGMDAVATHEEMKQFTSLGSSASAVEDEEEEQCLPWSHEEELLITRQQPQTSSKESMFSGVRPLVMLACVVSLSLSLVRTFRTMSMPAKHTGNAKYIV